jgi:hypothetical protein
METVMFEKISPGSSQQFPNVYRQSFTPFRASFPFANFAEGEQKGDFDIFTCLFQRQIFCVGILTLLSKSGEGEHLLPNKGRM